MGRSVQQQNLSLNMPLLLFTLLSTALAVPAPCPPMPPMDCGEGMTNCPGPIDPMGCMMPESCVAEGDACPFHCPPLPPMECGEGMINCPGLSLYCLVAAIFLDKCVSAVFSVGAVQVHAMSPHSLVVAEFGCGKIPMSTR